ncbi:MAG: DUF1569 domain-containing protein [Chitinophagaceae bacterium]|jgi:hypothetical protein|nr:DUF1569 domain-containing protein [Chitinophagaceae bacterium]
MASTIFNSNEEERIAARIASVQPTSPRQWGTMTPQEMCWHCRQQLEFVLQPSPVKVMNTMLRFQPFKWLAIFVIPWPKGSPTAPSMDAHKSHPAVGDMLTEKQLLLHALEAVIRKPDIRATHPLFGSMGKNYWGRLIWKHLDHHLRQFNC